jgi:hypothetical protein
MMSSFGLREAAQALQKRVGKDARYSSFVPPRKGGIAPVARREPDRVLRLLWASSLALLVVVLVIAVLVAVGL